MRDNINTKRKYKDSFLGTEKIPKLFARLSIPAVIATTLSSVYFIVDTIFVGQGVGYKAIGGISIAAPFHILMMAIGSFVGFGGASFVSRYLGSEQREKAYNTAGLSILISFLFGLISMFIGFIFLEKLVLIFGAAKNIDFEIINYSKDYLFMILFGSVFYITSLTSVSIIRAEGKSIVSMIIIVIGFAVNLILDPIFIFVFKLGIKGAALATVISQGISFLFIFLYFLSGKSSLKFNLLKIKIKINYIADIFKIGFPALIQQGIISVIIIILNNSLVYHGGNKASDYIVIFGIIMRLVRFIIMPLIGISQGFKPIAGYNYGAKKITRVKNAINIGLIITTATALFFFIIIMIFPITILRMFNLNSSLYELAKTYLRIIILAIPLFGVHFIGSALFVSVGKPVPAFLLGVSKNLFLFIPLILILPFFIGINGVLISFPIADFLSIIITVIFLLIEIKSLNNLDKKFKNSKSLLGDVQ